MLQFNLKLPMITCLRLLYCKTIENLYLGG